MQKILTLLLLNLVISVAHAQWTDMPSGVTIDLHDVYFTSIDTGFVVGDSLTILKTTNGGVTWDAVTVDRTGLLADAPITALNFNSTGNIGLATGAFGNGYYFLTTIDGGDNWVKAGQISAFGINAVALYDSIQMLAVGDGAEIFYSSNRGINWSLSVAGVNNGDIKDISCKDGVCAICLENGTIYKGTSINGNWTEIRSADTINLKSIALLSPNVIVAAGQTTNNAYVLKTTDGGTTWESLVDLGVDSVNDIYFPTESTGFTVANAPFIAASTDTGSTWSEQTVPTTRSLNAVHFVDNNTGYAVGNVGTVLKTENSGITGISGTSISRSIKAFPNPVGDKLTIALSYDKASKATVTIYGLNGQQMITEQVDLNDSTVNIEVNTLSSGLYLCRLVLENGEIYTIKLLKE